MPKRWVLQKIECVEFQLSTWVMSLHTNNVVFFVNKKAMLAANFLPYNDSLRWWWSCYWFIFQIKLSKFCREIFHFTKHCCMSALLLCMTKLFMLRLLECFYTKHKQIQCGIFFLYQIEMLFEIFQQSFFNEN